MQILVAIVLPEELLQANRFHRFQIQVVEQYEDFVSEEVSYLPDYAQAIAPTDQLQEQVQLKVTTVIQAQEEL